MMKKNVESEELHLKEVEVTIGSRRFDVMTLLQAQSMMVEDIEKGNRSSWDVAKWRSSCVLKLALVTRTRRKRIRIMVSLRKLMKLALVTWTIRKSIKKGRILGM
ncbi:hypothetical protein L2E82_44467 [Cichorium intybus]|uniref:Uncharacterized protein n=1 Tax=Cichorium intybus TaxID=13427 RepID=A0ACB8ZQM2_CICIN|nr:hypothetical protein L2E82_44467 [Cichorium intybus]